jgi:hypothetical protein
MHWRPAKLDIVENDNRLILFDFAVFCKMRSFQQAAAIPAGRPLVAGGNQRVVSGERPVLVEF